MRTTTPFWMTITVLIGITLLICLGIWQLSRAKYKLRLQQEWEARALAAPFSTQEALLHALKTGKAVRYQRVQFATHFMKEKNLLLDNQVLSGKIGYHVLTPVVLDADHALLVNRGWISLGKSRNSLPVLPTLPPTETKIMIEGYLDFSYANPFIGTPTDTMSIQWPLRIQQIHFPFLSQLLGKTLFPMLIVLNENAPYALAIPKKQTPYLSPQRHYAYAFQWFALACTLFISYAIFLKVKK